MLKRNAQPIRAVAGFPEARTWLSFQACRGLARNTLDAYGRNLDRYLRFLEPQGKKPWEVKADPVGLYLRQLLARPEVANTEELDGGLSNATVQQHLASLRLFYDYQESVVVEAESHLLQSFMSISANAEFGHRAPATLLRFSTNADTIHWREILEKNNVPPVIRAGLKAAVKRAEKVGFVERCLHIKPVTMPDFLTRTSTVT